MGWDEPCAVRVWSFWPFLATTRPMTGSFSTSSASSVSPVVTVPDLNRLVQLDPLGFTVIRQQIFPDQAVLFCQVSDVADRCRESGGLGHQHDTASRRFRHLPLRHRRTWLQVATPRCECVCCGSCSVRWPLPERGFRLIIGGCCLLPGWLWIRILLFALNVFIPMIGNHLVR